MRYTKESLLLLPPKCGSRYCENFIHGENVSGESMGVSDDWARHTPLKSVPESIKNGRSVFVMTRDPYAWYESWWRHMAAQDFAYNAYWGHAIPSVRSDGSIFFPRNVPDFKTCLKDYLFGHSIRKNQRMSSKIVKADLSMIWGEDHLLNQNKMDCGWWSYWMRYFSCDSLEWNTESRFIFLNESTDASLLASGFELSDDRKVVGERPLNERAPIRWDQEMISWIKQADGPTLELVELQKVEV